MYQIFSNFYTLLDEGVLFWGVTKLAGLSFFLHLLVKLTPLSARKAVAFGCFLVFFIFARGSLHQDVGGGYAALGKYYIKVNDASNTYLYFSTAYAWGERSPRTITWLIRHYCSAGDWAEAGKTASEALRVHPTDPEVLIAVGEMLLFRGNFDRAVELGRVLIQSDEMFSWMKGYDLLTRSLIRLNRYDEAIRVLREEIRRVPSPEVKRILEAEIASLSAFPADPPALRED